MSGEPDSGTSPILRSMKKKMEMEPPATLNNDDNECDNNHVTGSSNNFDSSEANVIDSGGTPSITVSVNSVGGSVGVIVPVGVTGGDISIGADGSSIIKLRCDRCDIFETQSRTLMIAHTAQCSGSGGGGGVVSDATSQQPIPDGGIADMKIEMPTVPSTVTNNNTDASKRKCFECDVCNMKFSNGANMRRHKMRHTGVKPYECRVCQKR